MQFWIFTLADFLADRYRQNADIGRIAQFQSYRVRTHLSSSNSMTFHDFFHDIFKFSRTLGLAVCFKTSKTFPFLDYFLTLNSSTDTNSGVYQNACRLRCLMTHLYLTLSLPRLQELLYQAKLKFSMTFKDRQLNSMTLQAWKMKLLISMTFQVFHNLYEPCRIHYI